ncbi:relaxase/mobilization nuclease domain-containing protein [uncultured Campylobacter sp.]|uniref:relaxase/mobilization nuclease domain-containing protein n=1 Tax=uncultured Campylobacter sp. TaxID=218934 RepID=UPI00261659E2|nr:relaxase/mobilization nuclease domain-containing protein [uncultured Campylobacter sp.]
MARRNWDAFFEELEAIRAGYTRTAKSEHKYVSFGGGVGFSRSHIPFPKNDFAKQSVVKMISNLPKTSIKRCIDYALKNSLDGAAINEKGERVGSDEILKEWGKDFGDNPNSKDAWHLIFSINEPCDDQRKLRALKESVHNVLGLNFSGHKYAFVLHTHQNNPHVHVVLNKRNSFTKKKIHFDSRSEIREFFDDVRTNFAYSLRARGLKYENKNFLQKDLKREFNRVKSAVKLESDDYTAKDKINDYYCKMQDKNKQSYDATAGRIQVLNDELALLKKNNEELLQLFLLYTKKRNKRAYKLAKELKESNRVIKEKSKAVLAEINKINKISHQATQLNEMRLVHYKDRSSGLSLLENFSYNYNKIYPKNKGASKSDAENYKKVRRAIAIHRDREDDAARKYFEDSLLVTRMLGRNESLFKLNAKLEILDKNLYVLQHSGVVGEEASAFEKRLKSNKEFIEQICQKRFEYVGKKLLNSDKINKDGFLFKEYFKGVSVLGVKADDRLVKIKNEPRLYKDALSERSGKTKTQGSRPADQNKFKNELGGRE